MPRQLALYAETIGSLCRENFLSMPGELALSAGRIGSLPGELALTAGRIGSLCRENWLSPVIQATLEARTNGWHGVERLIIIPSGGIDFVAAIWPPCLGKVIRGG